MGGNPMQSLPPELELPEGDRFTLPTVSAVRELIPSGGQLPAHMVLMMICGKELWVPLDKEIARQMANILAPFRQYSAAYQARNTLEHLLAWNSDGSLKRRVKKAVNGSAWTASATRRARSCSASAGTHRTMRS